MSCLKEGLSETRIVGLAFPMEDRLRAMETQRTKEQDGAFQARLYATKERRCQLKKELEQTRDMNPGGFWEHPLFSVSGIQFRPGITNDPKKVLKIVSGGLAKSDPAYIDKIILMARNPRAVAKSQERLRKRSPIPMDDVIVHSPRMFNVTTVAAACWIVEYKKPVLVINYDDLIEDGEKELQRVNEFIGGDLDVKTASKMIRPSLRRSYPEPDKNQDEFELADRIFELMKNQSWQEISDIPDQQRLFKDQRSFICVRSGIQVNEDMCNLCRTRPEVAANFRDTAETRRINWKAEPCLYEVGFGKEYEKNPITTEKSIKENHWLTIPHRGIGDAIHSVLSKIGLGRKTCQKCKDRRAWLNRMIPFRTKKTTSGKPTE